MISQELENIILKEEYEKIRKKTLSKKSLMEISLIYEIIEQDPTPKMIEDIIFGKRNYHVLLKHDALIRAIELDYIDILNKVVLFSSNVDLIKTAINYIKDDNLLKFIVLGANTNLAESKKFEVQNLALIRIVDDEIFFESFRKGYSNEEFGNFFKKIKVKSNFKTLSELHKRLIPLLISIIPDEEVLNEFARNDKYPKIITDLVTNNSFNILKLK